MGFVRDKLRSVGWTSGAKSPFASSGNPSVLNGASLTDRFESVDDAIRHFFRVTEEFHAARDAVVRRDGVAVGPLATPPEAVEDAIALILAEAADPKACSSGVDTINSGAMDAVDGSDSAADAGRCGLKAFIPPEVREIYAKTAHRVVERGVSYLVRHRLASVFVVPSYMSQSPTVCSGRVHLTARLLCTCGSTTKFGA